MTEEQALLSWLKDAHALEVGALPTLEHHAQTAQNYPEVREKLLQHLAKTRHHAELVEGCIKRLGAHPSTIKEAAGSAFGKVAGLVNLSTRDPVIKNALGDYAAEHFEIASYKSLIAAAEKVGDQETASVCRQILEDEEEMAGWLSGHIPTLTQQFLDEQTGEADESEGVFGKAGQSVADLGDKGKDAAANVGSKNALLASGALLAGAGAAMLIGQALRGKSDQDGSGQGGEPTSQAGLEESAVADLYDGYVSEVEVGSSAPVETSSLLEPASYEAEQRLEPRPDFDSDLLVEDSLVEDEGVVEVPVELVYTEVWLTPGPYTGIGPSGSAGIEDATGQEVYSRLTQHGQVDASLIEVTIDNGEVLLEGSVNSEDTKRAAEEAVASVAGVTKVQNLLQVQAASEGQTGGGNTSNEVQENEVQEFEHSTSVDASPDEVYAFMSKVENLPKYLPTTHSAQPQEGERVRVQGEAQGHEYDADGFFRQDEANHRIEWGADEQYYSGWLEVAGQGEGSTMTVHLSFSGGPPAGQGDAPSDESSEAPNREQIQEGLVKALTSIKNFVEEGRSGGKEEPGAAS